MKHWGDGLETLGGFCGYGDGYGVCYCALSHEVVTSCWAGKPFSVVLSCGLLWECG